jgi:cell wall-associated NlpC family hydrolase
MNFGKFALVVFVVFLVGFILFDREDQSPMPERQTTISALQPEFSLRDSLVEFGIDLLGTPYLAAGSGRDGFDCSGFVSYVFRHFKIKVPRSSADFEFFGTEIPIEEVQKGDLLLFLSPTREAIGHMGIVTNANGMESDFIHSTSGRQMGVVVTSLSNQGYTRRFVKAVRVL